MIEPKGDRDGSLTEIGGFVEYAVGEGSRAHHRSFGWESDLEGDEDEPFVAGKIEIAQT